MVATKVLTQKSGSVRIRQSHQDRLLEFVHLELHILKHNIERGMGQGISLTSHLKNEGGDAVIRAPYHGASLGSCAEALLLCWPLI